MSLTDRAIQTAKPRDRAYKLTDGRGLCLLVQPNGSKWWRYRYRFERAEKMLSLGTYPDVPLILARERCHEARRLLALGKDPAAERRPKRARLTSRLKQWDVTGWRSWPGTYTTGSVRRRPTRRRNGC